jgi:hypothetical protein
MTYTIPDFGPSDLLTSAREGMRRLRVDQGSTGFYLGREFRTFKEWPSATTEIYVIKAFVPVDIILLDVTAEIEAGQIRIETLAAGDASGIFGESLPLFNANNMTVAPQYTPATQLTAGGAIDGGLVLDVLRVKTDTNTQRSQSVNASQDGGRGIAPGTYHFRITLTAAIGTLKLRWEERPQVTN